MAAAAQRDAFSAAFRCVQAWLLEKPAAWADADAASLAALMVRDRAGLRGCAALTAPHRWPLWGAPGAEAREDNSPQAAESSYDLGERNLAELQMVREHAALFEKEGNCETWRREELERRVEILEEENRNLCRRTH